MTPRPMSKAWVLLDRVLSPTVSGARAGAGGDMRAAPLGVSRVWAVRKKG